MPATPHHLCLVLGFYKVLLKRVFEQYKKGFLHYKKSQAHLRNNPMARGIYDMMGGTNYPKILPKMGVTLYFWGIFWGIKFFNKK